jgi:hypothetical protein
MALAMAEDAAKLDALFNALPDKAATAGVGVDDE